MTRTETISTLEEAPGALRSGYCKLRNTLLDINNPGFWDRLWREERGNTSLFRQRKGALATIVSLIEEKSMVLDVGCGVGDLMETLKEEKGCTAFGIDISERAVISVIARGMNGVVAKVPPVPLPSDCFDAVVSMELLEHLAAPQEALAEMVRVARPGGQVIVTVPDRALAPYVKRSHLQTFSEARLIHLFSRVRDIESFDIETVQEEDEDIRHLMGKGMKRQ